MLSNLVFLDDVVNWVMNDGGVYVGFNNALDFVNPSFLIAINIC